MSDDDLAQTFCDRGLYVAVAESLTGGLLSDAFAKMPGASTFFRGGVVSYAAEVKRDLLRIGDAQVVSERAATAMADNVADLLGADVAVSVTGVGGPGPDPDGVAEGTVWLAVRTPGGTIAHQHNFEGQPADIVKQSVEAALHAVRAALSGD